MYVFMTFQSLHPEITVNQGNKDGFILLCQMYTVGTMLTLAQGEAFILAHTVHISSRRNCHMTHTRIYWLYTTNKSGMWVSCLTAGIINRKITRTKWCFERNLLREKKPHLINEKPSELLLKVFLKWFNSSVFSSINGSERKFHRTLRNKA